MENIKLNIIIDQTNWLEATWVEEIVTQVEGEEGEEDRVETTQVWCESYSGHPEHIAMLEAKALEFGTSLDEYESLIAECESKFIAPTEAELDEAERVHKIAEAKAYLSATDYKMTVDYFGGLVKEVQDELVAKRAEAREFIRGNN